MWKRKYPPERPPIVARLPSITRDWVGLKTNGNRCAVLSESRISLTRRVPDLRVAAPTGLGMQFSRVAAPAWYLTSSMRPNISGDISPPAKLRVMVLVCLLIDSRGDQERSRTGERRRSVAAASRHLPMPFGQRQRSSGVVGQTLPLLHRP